MSTVLSKPLLEHVRRLSGIPRNEFVRAHPSPVIVRHTSPMARHETDVFGTVDLDFLDRDSPMPAALPAMGAIEVRKRQRNAFADMITVGRTRNNDIILQEQGISKFHAWFSAGAQPGQWKIADGGSRNGTYLNDRRLEYGVPSPLSNGGRLAFTRKAEFVFYTPEGFYEELKNWAAMV